MPLTATIPTVERAAKGSLEDLRDRVSSAFRAQFPSRQADGTYLYSYVVATYADSIIAVIVSSEGEQYYRYDMAIDGESVTFSNPTEVELEYVPADVVAEAARQRVARASAPRSDFRESHALREAAFDAEGTTLTITVITPGFNSSRSRYYTEAALRSGESVFRGLKMYANHQTRAEEQSRPEGDVWQWVATVGETAYDATNQRLRATAKIVDPVFAEKVALLDKQGLLHELGVSIRAVGTGERATIEGAETFRVDEFDHGVSVDFVTEAGAGGYVELRESAEDISIHALTLPSLRESRPDLVAALLAESSQSNQPKEAGMEITQEQYDELVRRADEADRDKATAEEQRVAAESALEAEKNKTVQRETQEAIGKLIAESDLPKPSKDYLTESLTRVTDIEEAKTSIERHKTYVASLSEAGTVKGAGASGEGGGSAASLTESMAVVLGDEKAAALAAGR